MIEREVLGFVPILKPAPGAIQTAALMCCASCASVISGMGGPGTGALCIECVRKLIAPPSEDSPR